MAVFCPDVELPTISRKYYLHFRHTHNNKLAMPGTPRGISKHWGWGLATSRAASINTRDNPTVPAQADAAGQPHTPRGLNLLQAAVARSRTMLALVRTMSRHSGSSSMANSVAHNSDAADSPVPGAGIGGGSGRVVGSRTVEATRQSPPRQSAPGGVTSWLGKQASSKERVSASRLRRASDT